MKSLGRILSATRGLWPYYLTIAVGALLTAALTLTTPFLVKYATDAVVSALTGTPVGQVVRTVVWLAVALLIVDVVTSVVQNINGYFGDIMAMKMRSLLSGRYFAQLLSLPQRYFDEEVTGTIISRLSRSITEITTFLNSFSNNFLPMLLNVVAILIIGTIYYWPLALLLAVIFPAYMVLTALTSKRWQRLEKQKNEHIDTAGGRFAEVIGQIRVVKSFVQERHELVGFTDHYRRTIAITRGQSRWWHGMDIARRSFLNLVFFGIYLIVFIRTANGHFSIGDMVLLIQLVGMARMPVTMMSYLVDTTQRAIAGSRDYFTVMELPPGPGEPVLDADRMRVTDPEPRPVEPVPPTTSATCATPVLQAQEGTPVVEFDHVTFSYDGPAVLHDVSFTLHKGQRVALVSESGGGKTTMVSLMLGFYRPSSGHLRLVGQDISDMPLDMLRCQSGVVFQDASLFSGTIRENIAYGRTDATEAQIEQVARRANAHEFITSFPDGYDATIGERGLKLSGGQKQRIAIARAMLKDAPILILDEATSALDTKSERAVQQGLDELMTGRTTLIIAHRLSTISSVDTIITLQQGRIDEIGSPQELAVSGGIYSQLLALQASATQQDRERLREFGIIG